MAWMVTVPKGQGELHVSSMLLEKEKLSSKAVESLLLSVIHSMPLMQTCFIKRVASLKDQKMGGNKFIHSDSGFSHQKG